MTEIGDADFLNFEEALNNVNKLNNSVFNPQINVGALKQSVQTVPVQNLPVQMKQIQPQPQVIQNPPSMRMPANVVRPPQQIVQNHLPQNIIPTVLQNPELQNTSDLSSYFSIFGFQISRTTIYILIGFIVLLIGYFIYSKFFSKTEEKKKKKKSQVSFKSQEENEDLDENEDDE